MFNRKFLQGTLLFVRLVLVSKLGQSLDQVQHLVDSSVAFCCSASEWLQRKSRHGWRLQTNSVRVVKVACKSDLTK